MLAILVRRASQSTLLVKASQELVLCTTDETRATRSTIKTLVTDLQSYVETFETWGIPAEGSPVNMAKHEAMQEAFREMKELLSSSMAYDTKEILRGLDILGVINQVIKLKAIERGGGSTREKDGMNAASPNQSRPASSVTQIGLLETERAHNLLVSLQSNCWIILGMFVTNNVKNQLYVFHTRTFARLGQLQKRGDIALALKVVKKRADAFKIFGVLVVRQQVGPAAHDQTLMRFAFVFPDRQSALHQIARQGVKLLPAPPDLLPNDSAQL